MRCSTPRNKNSSVMPAIRATTIKLDRSTMKPLPERSVSVSLSAIASWVCIHVSTEDINDGNTICLFNSDVSVMVGEKRIILTSTSNRIFTFAPFFTQRYSRGAVLQSHATVNAGKRNVPRAEHSCIIRIIHGWLIMPAMVPCNMKNTPEQTTEEKAAPNKRKNNRSNN